MDDRHGLLGIPSSIDVDRLRAAYEGAMSSATHRQDWARARQLSAAFDRLPKATRLAAYPGRDLDAPRWRDDSPGPFSGSGELTLTGQTSRVRWRVVFSTVAILVAISTVGYAAWKKHARDLSDGQSLAVPAVVTPTASPAPTSNAPATAIQGRSAKSAGTPGGRRAASHRIIRAGGDVRYGNTGRQIGGLPAWKVPSKVPLDRRGRATVRCANTFTSTNWAKIDHRAIFACPIGQAPEFLVIKR